ncbi:PLDc N-terminal domain-containing protein [Zunongwangia sp. SCSIO 43204]|nr:PLDc N-terminal domain-containing protein [Zunongwangia sp. SCSIO 43204]
MLDLVSAVQTTNVGVKIIYSNTVDAGFGLYVWQLFSWVLIFVIPIHFVLLIIALIKIIRSTVAMNEKILYALISIFFPFFGSIIYFAVGKKA